MKAVISILSFAVVLGTSAPGHTFPHKCIGLGSEYTWSEAVNHFMHTTFRFENPGVQQLPLRRWIEDVRVNTIGKWNADLIGELTNTIGILENITNIDTSIQSGNGNLVAYIYNGESEIMASLLEDIDSVTSSEEEFRHAAKLIFKEKVSCWFNSTSTGGVIDRGIIYISGKSSEQRQSSCVSWLLVEAFGLNGHLPENYKFSSIKNIIKDPNVFSMTPIDKCALSLLYSRHFWPGIDIDRINMIIELKGKSIISE